MSVLHHKASSMYQTGHQSLDMLPNDLLIFCKLVTYPQTACAPVNGLRLLRSRTPWSG